MNTERMNTERGLATFGGPLPALCRAIDVRLLRAAREAGAQERQFSNVIERSTLERAGYYEAFANGATELAPFGDSPRRYALQPAVCYHSYAHLTGAEIDRVALTMAGRCYRREDEYDGLTRLWEFTMREVVLVGPPAWIGEERAAWLDRAAAIARGLGLEVRLEPATDPFFGPAGRARELTQRLKGLKHELRTAGPSGDLAIGSINLHEAFFAARFNLRLADGSFAHSACVAFGLERLAAAVMTAGPDAVRALIAEV
jgi:threonyl-tRNA synthetase